MLKKGSHFQNDYSFIYINIIVEFPDHDILYYIVQTVFHLYLYVDNPILMRFAVVYKNGNQMFKIASNQFLGLYCSEKGMFSKC